MNAKYDLDELKKFVRTPPGGAPEKDPSLPVLSVVIPSFNDGEYLERALLSIINQRYPNTDLIVIDGGSTDGTVDIIKKYQDRIAYWVSEKDRGQSDALNKGFRASRGDLVNELDADDIFLPGAFRRIADCYGACPAYDVYFGNRLEIDSGEDLVSESVFTRFSETVYLYDGMALGAQSAFWRPELFSRVGMYSEELKLTMDYEFFLKASRGGARFKYIPEFISAMRRHPGSLTEQFNHTMPQDAELRKIWGAFGRKEYLRVPLKLYSLVYRTALYFLQGDGAYVMKGFLRRLGKKTLWSGH